MFRIWAKIINDDKIIKDTIFESFNAFSSDSFYNALVEISTSFDIPTPIILKTHYNNFKEFNIANFIPRDFVETIEFDKLVIENAIV